MKTRNRILVAAVMLAALQPASGAAQTLSKDECRTVKKKIDNYRELRRRGGSGSQMDGWKRALREREQQYRAAGCKQYGKDFW